VSCSLDEDKAGLRGGITLARLDVATDELPLAVTSTHVDGVPGGLTQVDSVSSTAPARTQRRRQRGELLTLDADDRAASQSGSPVVMTTRPSRLGHFELSAVSTCTHSHVHTQPTLISTAVYSISYTYSIDSICTVHCLKKHPRHFRL